MFFDMPNPKKGECNPISYTLAAKRPDKTGKAYYITPVTWKGAPIVKKIVELKRLGTVEIVAEPPLPKGYRMINHDSLESLYASLYDPARKDEYSFQELDDIIQDSWQIEDVTKSYWELGIYDDRLDYCEWCCTFDEKWEELRSEMNALFDRANPHVYASARVLGGRDMPPDLKTALLNMLTVLNAEESIALSKKLDAAINALGSGKVES